MTKKRAAPPKAVFWLLGRMASTLEELSLFGDLEEEFCRQQCQRGRRRAIAWCWRQLLISLPAFLITSLRWSFIMLKNYLLIALRNLKRQKGFSFINITGLAVGFLCCMVIAGFVLSELNYDKYHVHKDRIFRVAQFEETEHHTSTDPNTAPPLIPALIQDFPEVVKGARIIPDGEQIVRYEDRVFFEENFMYADQDLFDILTIPLLKGSKEHALVEPGTLVISERMATKYFGSDEPMGKTLNVADRDYKITGIVQDSPDNTHLKYDLIAAFKFERDYSLPRYWMSHFVFSYIRLAEGVDADLFEQKMSKIGDRYASKMFERTGYSYTFFLQAVPDLHLYPCPHNEIEPPGDPMQLYILSAIGLVVLCIAGMNFVNLSTARSGKRAKEIGLRKVIGANRRQLVSQFLGESFLVSVLALMLAVLMALLLLPFLNQLTGIGIEIQDLFRTEIVALLCILVLFVGVGSGSYPAFLLSTYRPTATLKGQTSRTRGAGLRKVLVVGQFGISVFLIIGTLVISRQLDFMKNAHLGFDIHQKLVIPVRQDGFLSQKHEIAKTEFLKNPNITGASVSSDVPGQDLSMYLTKIQGQDDGKNQSIHFMHIDHDFIDLFRIRMAAGRNFDRAITSDPGQAFILNESAVLSLGWNTPDEALGNIIYSAGHEGPVIGVTEDFHFQGLQREVAPLIMDLNPDRFNLINLNVNVASIKDTLSFVENTWEDLLPGVPLEYYFLDESFNRHYQREEQIGRVGAVFTFLGLFTACLGLFGLASFMSEQRTKEIGIRKVLGASVLNIVFNLTKEFSKWVLAANLIAWPVAYFVMRQWLQNFAYRQNTELWIFMISAAASLVIALLTVSYQSVRVALSDPIVSLRYE
jgi:putative ABC transport system permease protein